MQFYVLENMVGTTFETTFRGVEPSHIGEGEDRQACPVCGEHRGMLPWFPPYRVQVNAYGRDLGDVAFGSELLVSERFRQAWTEAGLKGIDAFQPLERLRVRPARLGKKTVTYYYVNVRRFGTRVDLQRSLIDYNGTITCYACINAGVDNVRRLVIDEASWTGEDLFILWGKASIIVTDRVRQMRDEYGLTNVTLTPTEEYFWDPLSKWTPVDYSRDEIAMPDEDEECCATN